jgi:hypothetical protein
MEAIEVYRTLIAVKAHFAGSYHYFKYNGQMKASEEAFLANKMKHSFMKLARTANENEIAFMFALAYMTDGNNLWIRDFTRSNKYQKLFDEWKVWQDNRVENLTKDLKHLIEKHNIKAVIDFARLTGLGIESGQFPILFVEYGEGSINLSTLMILDHHLKLFLAWNVHLNGNFIWDDFYNRARRFRGFYNSWRPMSDVVFTKVIKECLSECQPLFPA